MARVDRREWTARELIEALSRAPNLDRRVEIEYEDDGRPSTISRFTVYADPEYESMTSDYNVVSLDGTDPMPDHALNLHPEEPTVPDPQHPTPTPSVDEALARCPECGSDDPKVRKGDCGYNRPHPFHKKANICPTCRSLHPDWDETGSRDFGQAVRRSKRHPAYRCPDPFHGETDPEHPRTRRAEDAEAIAYVSGVRDAAIDHDVEEAEALTRVLSLAQQATSLQEQVERLEAALRSLTRFDCETEQVGSGYMSYDKAVMEDYDDGDWVRWSEVEALLPRTALQGDGPDRKDNTR